MTFRRLDGRARAIARMFVFSLCVAAPLSGAVFAQSAPQKSHFRDARLLNILADDDEKAPAVGNGVVSAELRESKDAAKDSKIRPVSAANRAQAAKADKSGSTRSARAIAQAQYAESPTAGVTAQPLDDLSPTDGPFNDVCPDPKDMPSILDVPYKLIPSPGPLPESCPLPDDPYQRKAPTPITFTWKASSLCYKPLYFEDVQLERYGHYRNPWLQPFLSRARFLVTIPCLPYLIGVDPPNQCIYDLGYYRPGNCAPSMMQPIPISLRGGLLEAGAIVGAAAVIP